MAAPALQHFERPVSLSIRGFVVDDLGEVLPDAAVNLLFGGQPISRADSGDEGAFLMNELKAHLGIHRFRVSKPGYRTAEEPFNVTQDMADRTHFVLLRLTPEGWDDVSKDSSELAIRSFRGNERRSSSQNYVTVKVFFATDRKFANVKNVYRRFGNERSSSETLCYGVCDVSMPSGHRVGKIESPFFKWHVLNNPERHVALMGLDTSSREEFFSKLAVTIRSAPKRDAFVFIHGYNVPFAEAVRRTAQMAFDIGFQGAPICYSWPSSAEYSKYAADEAAVEWTIPHLRGFLAEVASDSGTHELHLIAHSMGNRALTRALETVGSESSFAPPCAVQQIILAAPDIDRGVFIQLARKLPVLCKRATLYGSSNDIPLAISKQFHSYPRAGEGGENLVLMSGVDSVEASLVQSGFLGHSYYRTRTVLSDIYDLVKHGTPPPRFGFKTLSRDGFIYWSMLP